MLEIVFFVLLISCAAAAVALAFLEAKHDDKGFEIYLGKNGTFIIKNNGQGQSFNYEIAGRVRDKETIISTGTVKLQKGETIEIPIATRQRFERITIRLPLEGKEIGYNTGYIFKEWKPEIVQGLPWDRQDEFVRNYYKYETTAPKEEHR